MLWLPLLPILTLVLAGLLEHGQVQALPPAAAEEMVSRKLVLRLLKSPYDFRGNDVQLLVGQLPNQLPVELAMRTIHATL